MHGNNKLQIGLFGANCSSGRAVTLGARALVRQLAGQQEAGAVMSDDAGIDFLLPIGRWKGYGGDTDYQGTTLETITWATGLLGATKRITVFGTVHAPIFNPVVAAKEMVTADHIGEGRFGLNIVVGWNEGEFDMFGVEQRAHEDRYEYAQEWIDVIKLIWSDRENFDFDGKYLHMKGIKGKPKPYGGARPVIMNAGASATGQAFAVKNCDAFFLQASRTSLDETAPARAAGQRRGGRARPRDRLLHRRRRHLPADQERGRGVFPSLHRRARRLERRRQHSGDEEHLAADRADGGIPQAAQRLCPGHGRPAAGRRSRSGRRAACRS